MTPFKLKKVKKEFSKISPEKEFSLEPFVKKWIQDHPPKESYCWKDKQTSFTEWKQKIKTLIKDKLQLMEPLPLNNQNLNIHKEIEVENIQFTKFSLSAIDGLRVPAILCIPQNIDKKMPAVICIHGHSQGKDNSVGIKKSKSKEYFGIELAQKGFITLSLDWIGAGEREKFKQKFLLFMQNEGERSNWLRFLGLDMLGLRITEIKGLLNYLETRSEVNSDRLGIIGHSGGGTLSLFSTIMDHRIKVCCTSGYFGTWEHSLLAMYHCGCNYSSDLARYIELYDLYACLAPLPIGATIGVRDKIYPIDGTNKAIPIIKQAYQESGKPDNFMIDVQPNGHRFYGDKLYPFLVKHLSI